MKRENIAKAKRVIAVLTIGAATGLSIAAQDRGGYITSTGRGGYIISTGRAETETTTASTLDGPTLGSGNRGGYISSTGRTDGTTSGDGTGTLGSGNLTTQSESGTFTVIWNWLTNII